jgi:hypothetical protein
MSTIASWLYSHVFLMSEFLEPQVKIENIDEALGGLEIVQQVREEMRNSTKDSLSESDFAEIKKKLDLETEIFAPEVMEGLTGLHMYNFTQKEDKIEISYSAENPLSDSDIEISQEGIESKFLSGGWYDKVLDLDYKIVKNEIKIALKVDKKWPVLICGGNVDANTAYILACFSKKKGLLSIAHKLLYHSAKRNNTKAMMAIASDKSSDHPAEAIYWISETNQVTQDLQIMMLAACLLSNFGGDEAKISENLFITLASNGFPDALYYLGYLHMKRPEGFIGSDELVIQYFTCAALQFEHLKALETLGKCYLNGICCEKNEEKGQKLLRIAGEKALNLLHEQADIEELNDNKPREKPITEEERPIDKEEKRSTALDIAVSAAVVGVAAVGIFFVFKRLMKKK